MILGTLNSRPLFAKGTMYVKYFDPTTNNMIYVSDQVQTNQLQSTLNMGAINTGIGNSTAIQIPDTPNLTLNMTVGDFSMEGRALSSGGDLQYNGVVPVDESVVAASNKLTVSQPPVAPLGGCDIVCTVNNSGISYLIDPTTKEVQGFEATDDQTYCVHYWTNSPSSQQLDINTRMAPAIVRAFLTIPVYAKEGGGSTNSGSQVGNLHITIPRGQLSGDISTDGSQTTPATTVMTLTALSYNDACEAGIQCGSSASPKLAYMVLELFGNPDQFAEALVIVGGNEIAVTTGSPYTIPLKYQMIDGSIVTPLMSDFNYNGSSGSRYFTVSDVGVINGTSAGSGDIVITSKYNQELTVTANVTVSGG